MRSKLSIRKTLGLLALAPLALAVSGAHANCSNDNLSVWSSVARTFGDVDVVSGGYAGTNCRLDVSIRSPAPGSAAAFVRDTSPADEPRYRARFLLNIDALTGLNSAQPIRVFSATTDAPSAGVPDVVSLSIFGNAAGTIRSLGISTACASSSTGRCSSATPLSAGVNSIEIDWQRGASGSLRVWVNSNTEASPTVTVNADSSAWGGVDAATLGLTAPSPGFRASQATRKVGFDEFDSRRQSFIGN